MELKKDMIIKKFKCSECGKIATFSGETEEVKLVECPNCSSQGKVRFPESELRKNTSFRLHKRKNYVKTLFTTIFIIAVFIAGFNSNNYLNYGNLSTEIGDLQYQIDFLSGSRN